MRDYSTVLLRNYQSGNLLVTMLQIEKHKYRGRAMARLKIFSKRETLVWCICLALAGFSIVALYVTASEKDVVDADVQKYHQIEAGEIN